MFERLFRQRNFLCTAGRKRGQLGDPHNEGEDPHNEGEEGAEEATDLLAMF